MNTANLKTELGRIRGAIMSGSFDRDTALDALDKAEKECDAATTKVEVGKNTGIFGDGKPAEAPSVAASKAAF